MFVVVKNGLYWIGGGWSNAASRAFTFSGIDLANEIADILGGRVGELAEMVNASAALHHLQTARQQAVRFQKD